MRERAKSLGSTVKKKIEKDEIMMYILNIMATAKDKEKNKVFNRIIKITKKVNPRILLIHSFEILPKIIMGIKLKKIRNKGIIWLNNKALLV